MYTIQTAVLKPEKQKCFIRDRPQCTDSVLVKQFTRRVPVDDFNDTFSLGTGSISLARGFTENGRPRGKPLPTSSLSNSRQPRVNALIINQRGESVPAKNTRGLPGPSRRIELLTTGYKSARPPQPPRNGGYLYIAGGKEAITKR